ncbi:tensin-3-like isoform X3 [Brienomyrus brachyistius]|uniref:tensin-3-like isoform X3 n=1 Tax=Brienomyrus brachyistius TaxID=42636 RepID=UPI0020B30620|nr:tensin-3-like isoform X3 [Brienomyrus brachyistius]
MEEGYELDLTYITERIIAVSFPVVCSEDAYRANLHDVTCMLKSKHADNYLVINLSEKRADLTKTNPKTMDIGWPDLHAPPLDKICTICKAMETWLNSDPQHVVVIHCRGGKGRIGVITSSFVHFTEVSASADQALERFAMRKFYDDKVSPLMTPSQKRYVWILNSLLTGSIKMNVSPHFLHCVILHGIPDFENGVCRPYLKVYQGLQLVYSSGIYHIGPGHRNRLYIALLPAQLLKGDILVKCYHKNIRTLSREPVFRLQFHTGTVQGCSLIFEKEDLENANKDLRFPDYGKVELVMSESPEKMRGSDRWENVPVIDVEYNTTDPLIRWDSYQNISCDAEDTTASEYRAVTRHGLSRQHSATEHSRWGTEDEIQNSAIYTPGLPSSQLGVLYRSDSIENKPHSEEFSGKVPAGAEMVASTPAFPIPPPTPYAKDLFEFSHGLAGSRPGASLGVQRTERESRGHPESLGHIAVSLDGEGFPVAFPGPPNPAAYQRPFASMRAGSVDGLISRTESSTSKPRLRQQCSLGGSGPGFASQYPGYLEYNPQTQYGSTHTNEGVTSYHVRYPLSCSSGQSFEEHDSSSPSEGDAGVNGVPEQPPLPEKRRVSQGEHGLGFGSQILINHSGSPTNIPCESPLPDPSARAASAPPSVHDVFAGKQETVKFVQDTSKFWYKPDISRDQAIAVLKDKEPGSFIVRDSHSFRGAYGLAMKVATPPPSVLQQSKRGGDLSNELVRHFLIERTQKGVRLKGCPKEPNFGSLAALVCHHSVSSLALPCMLIIPDRDPLEDIVGPSAQTATNSAAELLKQGAACNVWFLGSVEMESLTGYQAVQKATSLTLAMDPPPISTVVHFKVSAQGITLTDNQRKLFFRRHHAVNTVIFCALDPQDRKWTRDGSSIAKIFGFVARKGGSATENLCHLFAEHDPEQPASAIVNFVSKVMIGSARAK